MKAYEIFMLFGLLFPFFAYFLNKLYIKRSLKKGNMAGVEEGLRNIQRFKRLLSLIFVIVSLVFISFIVLLLSANGY